MSKLRWVLAILVLLIIPLAYSSHSSSASVSPTEVWESLQNTFQLEIENEIGSNDNIVNFTVTIPDFTIDNAYHPGRWTANISGDTITFIADGISISEAQSDDGFNITATANTVSSDTNSTWSIVTWDDVGGSSATTAGPVTIRDDAVAPTVTPILPRDMSFVKSGLMSINISATDSETGIHNASMQWDDDVGVGVVGAPDGQVILSNTDGYYTGTFDTSEMSFNESRYYLNFYYSVYDRVGNENTKTDYHIFVDTEAPELNLESVPSTNERISAGTYTFMLNATDNSFAAESQGFTTNMSCDLYISEEDSLTNFNLYDSAYPMQNAVSTNLTADLSSLEDGTYYWYISCIDDAGWETSTALSLEPFIIDNNPPKITLVSPTNNLFIPSDYTFSWIVIDVVDLTPTCDLSIDNVVEASPDVTGLSEGQHSWNVTCWDDYSNSNTSETWDFIVDTTPPTNVIIGPDNDTINTNGTMEFEFNPDDNLDDEITCTLYINNQSVETIEVPNGTDASFNYNQTSEGEWIEWYIICSDELNSDQSDTRWIYLDTYLAAPTFSPASPIDTDQTSILVDFTATFNEEVSIDSAVFEGSPVNLTTTDNLTFIYSATVPSDATYNFSVAATDLYGHSNSGQNTYTITYSPPPPQPASTPNTGPGGRDSYSGYEEADPLTILSYGDCAYTWTCGEWSECTDGTQTRTCTNKGECLGNKDRPPIERDCTVEAPVEEETPSGPTGITGWFVGGNGELNYQNILITIGLIAFTSAMGLVGRFYKKKRESYYDNSDLKF